MDSPFVGDTVNSFVSGFLSVTATLFVLIFCLAFITQTRQAPISLSIVLFLCWMLMPRALVPKVIGSNMREIYHRL